MAQNRCVCCGSLNVERHHFKTRGSGGSDENFNILFLCRLHHVEIHKIGNNRFANKFPEVKKWLSKNNWIFDDLLKKWKRYE